MDNFNEMLDKLRDSSGEMKSNLHMLREIIPIEEQMRYFDYVKNVRTETVDSHFTKEYLIARLFTPELGVESKRFYLALLAAMPDVAVYRAIETYHSSPLEPELANWSTLALMESRILLDSDLSGERQFFVSTGLGGKEGKLRYFLIITTDDRTELSCFQKDTLKRELQFSFEKNEIEIESIDFKPSYLKMFLFCGLNHDPRVAVEEAIKECNELGCHFDTKFLLTNVKLLDDEEIKTILLKKE
ncbi:hypothetical protein M2132_000335 [Dysgonomonas sp. PH5-45]|uniref:hypothetical protein n=1 Tax=unclassified Dysgonomonas TaxID=2630389 RepID=UPI0024746F1D|nr:MULTISPECIES: hypothetical protein [unclassified Dysgonomonas]MDH6354015.1 hypothetical protein [Dysgonomonas sp. PH5-45]MDH6386917.1 hypothetical protein [Dysgonomonas sp. PH5-37]